VGRGRSGEAEPSRGWRCCKDLASLGSRDRPRPQPAPGLGERKLGPRRPRGCWQRDPRGPVRHGGRCLPQPGGRQGTGWTWPKLAGEARGARAREAGGSGTRAARPPVPPGSACCGGPTSKVPSFSPAAGKRVRSAPGRDCRGTQISLSGLGQAGRWCRFVLRGRTRSVGVAAWVEPFPGQPLHTWISGLLPCS
jgi:hypothetical protein